MRWSSSARWILRVAAISVGGVLWMSIPKQWQVVGVGGAAGGLQQRLGDLGERGVAAGVPPDRVEQVASLPALVDDRVDAGDDRPRAFRARGRVSAAFEALDARLSCVREYRLNDPLPPGVQLCAGGGASTRRMKSQGPPTRPRRGPSRLWATGRPARLMPCARTVSIWWLLK
jgi:hypothetical protein